MMKLEKIRVEVNTSKPSPIAWLPVRCPHCGKIATEATPGSTVKVKCRECKRTSAVTIAA